MCKRGRTGRAGLLQHKCGYIHMELRFFQNVMCCLAQLNAAEAADWPHAMTGEGQLCEVPHEGYNHELHLCDCIRACLFTQRAKAYVSFYLSLSQT